MISKSKENSSKPAVTVSGANAKASGAVFPMRARRGPPDLAPRPALTAALGLALSFDLGPALKSALGPALEAAPGPGPASGSGLFCVVGTVPGPALTCTPASAAGLLLHLPREWTPAEQHRHTTLEKFELGHGLLYTCTQITQHR